MYINFQLGETAVPPSVQDIEFASNRFIEQFNKTNLNFTFMIMFNIPLDDHVVNGGDGRAASLCDLVTGPPSAGSMAEALFIVPVASVLDHWLAVP